MMPPGTVFWQQSRYGVGGKFSPSPILPLLSSLYLDNYCQYDPLLDYCPLTILFSLALSFSLTCIPLTGTLVIEVLPRTFCYATFCEAIASNSMKLLEFGQSNAGRYDVFDWCNGDYAQEKSIWLGKSMCETVPKPYLNEKLNQHTLVDTPYFDTTEINTLVDTIRNHTF
jgi:hypothetical protein